MIDKNTILTFQILSTIFTIILGTILHFTFKWSNKNSLVGTFSAVNESTWEHLKLLFFPMLISIIVGYFYIGKNLPNFVCVKTLGIIIAMLFTVSFFYTYTGILGTNYAILNILAFIIAAMLGEYISYKLMFSIFECSNANSIIILSILFISFIIFTFSPPKIGLFKDPINNTYGIQK